jgi:prepilin-type processing-associated H-X9-DG protein
LPQRGLHVQGNAGGACGESHNGAGNIALTDGSVQQLASSRMREALEHTGDATNRVQLP